jgi:hypothetical protein
MNFQLFAYKSGFPCKTQNILRGLRNFTRFFVPRGPDAPGPLKPMQFHPFLEDPGALGPIFAKNHFFTKLSQEMKKVIFSQILAFLMKIMISAKSTGLQKHQYSLSFINSFGGSMAWKTQNSLNSLKCLDFSEISSNSIILCNFQHFQ